ncbi:MAG: hypothetical protein WBM87_00650 [Woeseiaceae bacterium]
MNKMNLKLGVLLAFVLSAFAVAGCGGTKVLKEPQALQTTQSLATASEREVVATLDWVIVRDGPGTWARNADWDEYLLRVNNQSDQPITVTRLVVVDSLDTRIESQPGRKELIKNSKKTARRYKASGIKVRAGRGAGTMLVAGAAVTVIGVGAASAAATGAIMSGAATAGGAGAAAGGLLLLGPALAVGGIVRGVNNSKVNNQIELRQTLLPAEIPASEEAQLDVFFPLAPSPKMIELYYFDAAGEHRLVIDTRTALDGLHIDGETE